MMINNGKIKMMMTVKKRKNGNLMDNNKNK